jgi:pyruvate/2-oxoglutarate/acetoin dehydrogenase E1 component
VIRIASHFCFNKAEGESEAAQRYFGPFALNEKSMNGVAAGFADAGDTPVCELSGANLPAPYDAHKASRIAHHLSRRRGAWTSP